MLLCPDGDNIGECMRDLYLSMCHVDDSLLVDNYGFKVYDSKISQFVAEDVFDDKTIAGDSDISTYHNAQGYAEVEEVRDEAVPACGSEGVRDGVKEAGADGICSGGEAMCC